jgi:hypothetical protein
METEPPLVAHMLPVLIQTLRPKRRVQLVLGGRLSPRIGVLSMRFAMLRCRSF